MMGLLTTRNRVILLTFLLLPLAMECYRKEGDHHSQEARHQKAKMIEAWIKHYRKDCLGKGTRAWGCGARKVDKKMKGAEELIRQMDKELQQKEKTIGYLQAKLANKKPITVETYAVWTKDGMYSLVGLRISDVEHLVCAPVDASKDTTVQIFMDTVCWPDKAQKGDITLMNPDDKPTGWWSLESCKNVTSGAKLTAFYCVTEAISCESGKGLVPSC